MNCTKTTLIALLLMGAATIAHAQRAITPAENPQTASAVTPPPSPAVVAQQTDARNTTGEKTAGGDDEIVEMSPFIVTERDGDGYLATMSISSGRLATDLKDMAANVDVLTKAMLEDLGATDLSDMMEFTTSAQLDLGDFEPDNNIAPLLFESTSRANYMGRVRGMQMTRLVGNEIVDWEVDNFNISRTDIYLGTDAILFGNGAPGGFMNSTRDAADLRRSRIRAELRLGSYDDRRFTLDYQAVLIRNKLGIRAEMVTYKTGSFREYFYKKRNVQYVTMTYKPFQNTTIYADYEMGRTERQQGLVNAPTDNFSLFYYTDNPAKFSIVANTVLGTTTFNPSANNYFYGGRNKSPSQYPLGEGIRIQSMRDPEIGTLNNNYVPLDIYDINEYSYAGPDSRYFQKYRDFRVTLEQRLATNMHFCAYYRSSDTDTNLRYINRNPTPTFYMDPLPSTGPDDEFSGRIYTISKWRKETYNPKQEAFSTVFLWSPNFGKWGRHNLSLAYDDRNTRMKRLRYEERAYRIDAEGVARSTDLRRINYFDPNDKSTWHLGNWSPVAPYDIGGTTYYVGFLPIGDLDNGDSTVKRTLTRSYTAALQSYWFNHRFVTSLGFRRDITDIRELDPQFGPDDVAASVNTTYLEYYDTLLFDRQKTTRQSTTINGVLHLNKKHTMSIFAGYAGNIGDPFPDRVLPDGELPSPQNATNLNYGVRLEFLQGKVSIRLGGYSTTQKDSYRKWGGFWNALTYRGGNLTNYQSFIMDVLLPDGTFATEQTLNTTPRVRILDDWIDLTAANGVITPEQKALYDKQLGRNPTSAEGNLGVYGMKSESQAKGYELNATFMPFKGLEIRLNYSYNKVDNEKVASDLVDWLEEFYGYVAQLPQTVLDAPYNMAKLDANAALNRPGGAVYTNGQVFEAIYYSLNNTLDDQISNLTSEFGNRRHKLGIMARYQFHNGPLKGLSVSGNYSYQSGAVIARLRTISADGQSLVTEKVFGPSINTSAMSVSYQFRKSIFGVRTRTSASLRVSNPFRDKYEMIVQRLQVDTARVPGLGNEITLHKDLDGNTVHVPLRWSFAAPRSFTFTVRVDF